MTMLISRQLLTLNLFVSNCLLVTVPTKRMSHFYSKCYAIFLMKNGKAKKPQYMYVNRLQETSCPHQNFVVNVLLTNVILLLTRSPIIGDHDSVQGFYRCFVSYHGLRLYTTHCSFL